jgi:uncharacterized protein
LPLSRSRWTTNGNKKERIKNKKRGRIPFVIFSFLFFISSTAAAQTFPKATGRVNDFANVIDPATEAALDRDLDQLEQKTSSEIAVATVESLNGMSVEEYANKLFKEWGVGQAKQDNGVLVVVAPNEREMRIEVGYGLEGVLPDGLAGQVIRDDFTPRFKEGDYSGGIRNGVAHLVAIVEKHQVLTPEELEKLKRSGVPEFTLPHWIFIPFFGVFVTIGFGMAGIGIRTKTGFPLMFGSAFGIIPLLMSMAFMFKVAMFTLVPWAVLVFVQGYRLGGREKWRDAFRDTGSGKGGGSSSGWTMGTSSSSGSSSSSSSSGSSSSFGGGSSGGGGASGRW